MTEEGENQLSKYRIAACAHFLIDGVGFGVWATLLPDLKQRLEISESELSIILLAMVVGAVAAMTVVGRVIERFGSDRTLKWIAPIFCASFCLPILLNDYTAVMLGAFVFGALKGSLDVSVNTHIIAVERALGRILMSSAQALWSIGGVIAAILTGVALKSGVAPSVAAVSVALVLIALARYCAPRLMVDRAEASPEKSEAGAGPNRRLWWIGLIAFCALFTEGAMMDWSAIYALEVGHAAEWLAPLAYGVYCSAMAAGRLSGDWLIGRFGYTRMLRFSGLLTAAGILLMVLFPYWPITFLGLVGSGLGLANLVPIFLNAAGKAQPWAIGRAVAMVSMIGYTGFLAGPPVIGLLSAHIGLPGAFSIVMVLIFAMGLWGTRLLTPATQLKNQNAEANVGA